ncbi:MAG: hypothetical protein JXA41_11600 [Deltaproteobacteria bacterium]|nr:hypothetical protein [Deltaproteobacteria bacterium]
MKRMLKKLSALCTVVGVIFLVATIAFAAPPNSKTFTNDSPAFSVSYPQDWDVVDFEEEDVVFKAATGAYQLPNFIVIKAKAVASTKEAVEQIKKRWDDQYMGKNFKTISEETVKLEDGTPAFMVQISWDHPMVPELKTCYLIATKGNTTVAISSSGTKPTTDEVKMMMKSLSIK